MKPASKATGTKGLKPRYDVLLLNVAFNFNLRRYTKVLMLVPMLIHLVWMRSSVRSRVASEGCPNLIHCARKI